MNLSEQYLKETYRQRLLSRFWLSVLLIVLLGGGTVASIHAAFTRPELLFTTASIMLILSWTVLTGVFALFHSNNNRSIHSLENYFGYHGDRASARHEHFCTNLLHCAVMHSRLEEKE